MSLDFVPSKGAFVLKVPRADSTRVQTLIREHGFDFSMPASTAREAVLFTKEEYAAASFAKDATPAALARLAPILEQVTASWATDSGAHIRVPIDRELWSFQKAGVEYALRRNNTLIGDQPGLGKTEQAICIANEINAKRVLVICPAALRRNVWLKRIPMWTTMLWPYHIYVIEHGYYGVSPVAEWTIVSYDLARSEAIGRALAVGKYDLVIMDEIHYCKTIDTNRTQAIFGDHTGMYRKALKNDDNKIFDYETLFRPISKSCGMMLGLTGTIMPNRPREAYVVAHNFCFAAGTRVLTSNGIKPIETVTTSDLLWDGIEWITHQGLSRRGKRKVVCAAGVWATPEHRVFIGDQTLANFSEFLSREKTSYLMSATGLVSLLCWGIQLVQAEQPLLYAALAETAPTELLPSILDAFGAADLVHLSSLLKDFCKTEVTQTRCLNLLYVIAFLKNSMARSGAVITPKMMGTNTTALEEFLFIHFGDLIGRLFLSTFPHWKVLVMQVCNWIGSITTEITSPEISSLATDPPTCEIAGLQSHLLQEFKSLRECFDLVHAGPRKRFTILTNDGALLVHNCPDAIDWMSERAFGERFNPTARIEGFKKDGTAYIYTREEVGRASELQNRMRANFMVRRLKRDVAPQLHMPIYDVIQVEETKAVKMALEAENLLGIEIEQLESGDITTLGVWAIVRQQLGIAMAPQVADYAAMLIDGGEEKLVIFAWHHAVLDILQERLRKFGVLRIDGSTSNTQREKRVIAFVEDKRFRIMLGNTLSLGTGTDRLQHVSSHALIAEPDPVPGNNEQAVDRLDRIGQQRTVQADLFVAPKSLLEKILTSALRKRHNTHKALDERQ